MAVSACLAAYEEGRLRPERVWHLVALELWFRSFIDPGVPQGLTIAKPRIKLTGW